MKMKKLFWAGALVAVALVGFLLLRRGPASEGPATLYATAAEGPLVISVEEFGEIAPSQQIVLKNEVQGRVSIISLIPDRTLV